ncbi:unnamed protein product [Miscanthus lutarioriparius]|uniref:Uncharacterized protein n=1 Tax=Miscanthus lutarioriparius TaxID=422564 RepID=A0A811P5K5_9POAL|nr:unnamed protein product [Miscanthus lutarioriparius]
MGVVVVVSDARDGGTNDGSGPARRALPDHAMRRREHLLPFGIVAATETKCLVIGFQVLCSNNIPYFGSSPYSPRILDIFYDNLSFLIADVHKLDDFHSSASKPCHSPTNNSSSKVGPPFSICPGNQNMIFYDCEEPPTQAERQRRGLVDTACGNRTLVGVAKRPDVPGSYFMEGCNATVMPMLARSGEVNPANYKEFISEGFLLTCRHHRLTSSQLESRATTIA